MVIIVNGAAGGGRASQAAQAHVEVLASSSTAVVHHTAAPGHAIALARAAAVDGVDTVVAVGGDGTVFEVVNGLLDGPPGAVAPRLGLIPLGTGNSFVRDLGLSDPVQARQAILQATPRPVDVVRVVHRQGTLHFVNLLSVGFSARAGALTNRRYKPLGVAGYVLAVLECLVDHRIDRLAYGLDGQAPREEQITLLSFCNSRFTGGNMMMAPDALIDDGALDVVRIGPMGRRRFLTSFPRIFRGTHVAMSEVHTHSATEVAFGGVEPVLAMIDGEVQSLYIERLEVVPSALQVLA